MALKRKTKVSDSFSMASMTDVIFLLLIFFLVTSTVIIPNAIKVSLPSAAPQQTQEQPQARITITPEGKYYLALEHNNPVECSVEQLQEQLGIFAAEHPEAFVSIQGDEQVAYKEVVAAINSAASAALKVVLATRVVNPQQQQ